MKNDIASKALAELCGVSRKALLARAAREGWRYIEKKGRMYWSVHSLPSDVQIMLARATLALPNEKDESEFCACTEKEREAAKKTAALINAYSTSGLSVVDFCFAFNAGEISRSLRAMCGEITKSTLYRNLAEYKQRGAAGLIPQYSRAKQSGAGASLSESEKTILEYFYLAKERRSIRHVYLLMQHNIPESRATYDVCYRYVKSLDPDVVDFYRYGRDAYEAKHFPYIERNKALYRAMDQVQGDHHIIDRVVRFQSRTVRPWVTTFIDFRSGAVLGYCLSVSPSSRTILIAYYMMAQRFGIPIMVHVDNGKDYRSESIKGKKSKAKVVRDDGIEDEEEIIISGAITLCGSRVQYARKYHGQSKGVQERFYGILEEYYSKDTGNYIGSNTASRVDEQRLYWRAINGQAKRNDIIEWPEFVQEFSAWIEWYNTKWKSQATGREGLTPMEAFETFSPETIKRASPETLELALTKGDMRTVGENGVRIGRSTYWAPELGSLTGQRVIARQKMLAPEELIICNVKGQIICTATADYFLESGNMELDNERVNAARRDKLALTKAKTKKGSAPYTTQSIVDAALIASGHEPVQELLPAPLKKAVGEPETLSEHNGKYKNYFDLGEEDYV